MRNKDNKRFAEALAILGETYKPFNDVKQRLWAQVFKDYEIEDFEAAIWAHITDLERGAFEPKPADILKHMIQPEPQRAIENKGGLSWCESTQKLLDKYPAGNRAKIQGQSADLMNNLEDSFNETFRR